MTMKYWMIGLAVLMLIGSCVCDEGYEAGPKGFVAKSKRFADGAKTIQRRGGGCTNWPCCGGG